MVEFIFGAAGAATSSASYNPMPLLLAVLAVLIAGYAARAGLRAMRARKTHAATGGDFAAFALEALVSAAKVDGRVTPDEQRAVAAAMRQLAGATFDATRVDAAFADTRLTKDELVDYLASRSGQFSAEQKGELLRALLAVFTADADFDAAEHTALVEYTAAIGFDRHTAPERLRQLAIDLARDRVT